MKLPGHRRAALSFTFDDGSQCHAETAAPLLEEFGFRGTFFVIAGLTRAHPRDPLLPRRRSWWAEVSWAEWRGLAAAGHEIGNHSLTHPKLPAVRDPAQLRAEVAESTRLITEQVGRRPVSFAYPFNKRNGRVRREVVAQGLWGRERECRYGGWGFSWAAANRRVERAIREGTWVVVMIHGIGGGFQSIDAGDLRAHLRFVKERESAIWVAPFGEVSRHVAGV